MPSGNQGPIVVEHASVISPPRPTRPMAIKNLMPQLPERGKIKIGAKGKEITSRGGNKFQPPVKLDYFRITTLQRREDGNLDRDPEMFRRFGEKPTEIPVRLLYDDPTLNFPTRYAAFVGRTLWCSGDGESAMRLAQDGKDRYEIKCPCPLSDPTYQQQPGGPPKCKMNGALSVLIEGASGLGGVWKFRTTSYNSITGIMGAMIFIRQITGGPLANIPLKLRVQPKQATVPTDGTPVLIYVVSLEFDGDVALLQQVGHQIALDRARTHVSIAEIETEARRMLALAAPANAPLPGDEPEDVVAEFYPEQMQEDDAAPPARQRRPLPRDFLEDPEMTEPQSFAVTDFVGEVRNFPTEAAAVAWFEQLIIGARSTQALDGLMESNPGIATYPTIIEAYKDQKEALADPGNRQDRPATGAPASPPPGAAEKAGERLAHLGSGPSASERPESTALRGAAKRGEHTPRDENFWSQEKYFLPETETARELLYYVQKYLDQCRDQFDVNGIETDNATRFEKELSANDRKEAERMIDQRRKELPA